MFKIVKNKKQVYSIIFYSNTGLRRPKKILQKEKMNWAIVTLSYISLTNTCSVSIIEADTVRGHVEDVTVSKKDMVPLCVKGEGGGQL